MMLFHIRFSSTYLLDFSLYYPGIVTLAILDYGLDLTDFLYNSNK